MNPRHSLLRTMGPALLLAGTLGFPTRGSALPYPSLAHLDGYLSASGNCVLLRQHDGRTYSLRGELDGLRSGDHVRLEGRFAPDPGCGAPGFGVTGVQELWADDNHRSAYFDIKNGEPFGRYAERIGRFNDRSGDAGEARRDADVDIDADRDRDHDRDRDREHSDLERADRNGRYVYQGPHRQVTLVGKLHEVEGGCPTLHTTHAVFALDGDLRVYQAGDDVSVSGTLYDGDPNAPCGGATVVIGSIHGHGRR
jgi:hypothetical protein